MRRFSFLIAATVLVGMFWGGVADLVDRLGIHMWLQTRMEASDNSQGLKASSQEK